MEWVSLIPSTDVAVLVALVSLVVIYGALFGTALLLRIIVALPIATFLYNAFPYTQVFIAKLSATSPSLAAIIIFTVFTGFCVWLLTRIIGSGYGSKRIIHIITTAAVLVTLFLTISHIFLSIDQLYTFGEPLRAFFASSATLFWVSVIGFFALFAI